MTGSLDKLGKGCGFRVLSEPETQTSLVEGPVTAAPPRVAFFPDSFHEVNGVAHTARQFLAFARRRELPLLCIHAGPKLTPKSLPYSDPDAPSHELELPRSRLAVGLEKDLAFDPIFFRHAPRIARALRAFRPDLIHFTGPSELGMFAAWFAWRLRLPMAASWHTNVHEYAGRRLQPALHRLARSRAPQLAVLAERLTLDATARFYRLPRVLFAPNPGLCDLLHARTGRPVHLMQRGVDTELFRPAATPYAEPPFILGFVGRLSVEKNVALLPQVQATLDRAGIPARFLIAGHGEQEPALRQALPTAEFAGVLRGEALAAAYRRMDLFVFPSHTDTFGNVVLEALASGVPALVTPSGGPSSIVRSASASAGAVAEDAEFGPAAAALLRDPARLRAMRAAARQHALRFSWDAVFAAVYAAYPTPNRH